MVMTIHPQVKANLKLIAQLLGAILIAVMPLLTVSKGYLTTTEWINVGIVAVGAFVVWNTANFPTWAYGKLLASAAITGLTMFNTLYVYHPEGITISGLTQIALAVVTSIAVGVVPNVKEVPVHLNA